jgi:hypothetical protein
MPSPSDQLDLHDYTVTEAIERFVEQYNFRVKNGQCGCWTIVHGYGSSGEGGAIRSKLRAFLDQHLDKLRYESGDNYGNPGWTWVYPILRLPDRRERLAQEILEFCSTPRVEEKILREFAVAGGVQVKEILRSLAKQGRLKTVTKGAKAQYQACASGAAGSKRST